MMKSKFTSVASLALALEAAAAAAPSVSRA